MSTEIIYSGYKCDDELPEIITLISKSLSETYSIFVYRYFIVQWPQLCFVSRQGDEIIGVIIGKLEKHSNGLNRGYIAMLAIADKHRRKGIAKELVLKAIKAMKDDEANEIVLETEVSNAAAMKLYEGLGFIRSKKLYRYYLNAQDAYRLVLPF